MKLTDKNKAACSAITRGFYRVMEKGVRPISAAGSAGQSTALLLNTVLTSDKVLTGS